MVSASDNLRQMRLGIFWSKEEPMQQAVGSFIDAEGRAHNKWEEIRRADDDEPVDISDLINSIPRRPSSAELRDAARYDELGDIHNDD